MPLRTIKIIPYIPPQQPEKVSAKVQEKHMSLFSKIEGAAKTIAHSVEEVFVKLFQEEPKIEAVIVSTISAVAPFVVAIAAVAGTEVAAAEITAVITEVKQDMAVIQVTLNAAGAGTANVSVKSLLAAINANLASLLTAGMIKNPETLAKITADVEKISSALNILIAAL